MTNRWEIEQPGLIVDRAPFVTELHLHAIVETAVGETIRMDMSRTVTMTSAPGEGANFHFDVPNFDEDRTDARTNS